MKAAVLYSSGAIPEYTDFAEPPAGEHRQLMSLVAAGIHPVTRAIATGMHYSSDNRWPLIPGIDAVARTADGTLVYTGWTAHPFGTLAERMATPMGTPLPEGADPVQIAGGLNPGLSSWLPLLRCSATAPLGTVLILGATGVAGNIAVQNARALGAEHIIAAGRKMDSLSSLAGPDLTPVRLAAHPDPDLRQVPDSGPGTHSATHSATHSGPTPQRDRDAQALADAVAEHRPTTVLDFLWGKPAEAAFAALARAGLDEDNHNHTLAYIEIGESAGATAAIPASLL